VPADRLVINPDCGLRHVPGPVARAKLAAMVEGTAIVRRELAAQQYAGPKPSGRTAESARSAAPQKPSRKETDA
jgi:5-methyltetrahydropteroyltriglutamate--homocysteine methyltransferase